MFGRRCQQWNQGNVATVTKQKAFNKSMITPFTEVIFIDEATEHTLDIDDWKILTQGGYAAHDVKYQSARAFINRCPMLITSQRKLEFGPADQPAMERRLRTYTFRSLPRPKKKASNWMRTHPMDCVLWAAQEAKEAENEDESEGDSEENTQEEESTFAEGVLREEEKAEIRSTSLPVLLAKEMQRSTRQTRGVQRTRTTAIQVRPHPHRQIVWRIYEISLRRHSRVACATDTSHRC